MEFIFDLADIRTTAKSFLELANRYKVFAFSGDLGAGKTTFINALCNELGVSESISSPTFSIIQEYEAGEGKIIYHIDLYRIKNKEEAIEAGIEDCIYSDEISFVEWPEKAPALFPFETIYATLEIFSAQRRKLIVQLP